MRVAYLGLLWVLGLTAWQYTVGWEQTATLGDNARFGFLLFQVLTYYVQLPLLIFFSALSAASAVAREKDRRTFILLLMTDLRNYEIVLGKLLGSLLQIALLLGTMVPFLFLLVLLGGVAPEPAFAPAYGFAVAMLLITILLNAWAILRLRVWNPSGEPIMQREAPGTEEDEDKDRAAAHAAPGALRKVWSNPILWREMCTRAYGRRPLLVKVAYFIVLALICTFALEPLWASGPRSPYLAAYGLVSVG